VSEKPIREAVSKKTRFEVFKRDQFTCQYCGAKAPEVVLHADHIRPVADGGKSEIMNLVTACAACNGGKGARLLDDRSAVERQRTQIEELEDRREQLEMMLAWRDAAQAQTIDVVEEISDRLGDRGGFVPNESGKADIRKWLKRFELQEILVALDEAFDHYMKWRGNDPDREAWTTAFRKIPVFANMNRQAKDKPDLPRLLYIQGILRNRCEEPYENFVPRLEDARSKNWSLDDLEEAAKKSRSWNGFVGHLNKLHEARHGS
jgi:hypothetical protein